MIFDYESDGPSNLQCGLLGVQRRLCLDNEEKLTYIKQGPGKIDLGYHCISLGTFHQEAVNALKSSSTRICIWHGCGDPPQPTSDETFVNVGNTGVI